MPSIGRLCTKYLRKKRMRRVRHILRGHRILKNQGNLVALNTITQLFTESRLELRSGISGLIFGAGLDKAEFVIRQYLLTRVAGQKLNKAILFSLGKDGARITHPLPKQWREILKKEGYKVAEYRSALSWQLLLLGAQGLAVKRALSILFEGIKAAIRPLRYEIKGKYVYFFELTKSSLPSPEKNSISYDIISWYNQWPGKIEDVEYLCHSVPNTQETKLENVSVIKAASAIPALAGIYQILMFTGWLLAALAVALFDLTRNRWWHALLMAEAVYAAQVRLSLKNKLAKEYLWHNSSWIYRPLWTYEAEKHGSRITVYFYSTSLEPFRRPYGYPRYNNSWEATSWPRYLVWDNYQADFLVRSTKNDPDIRIVGPIWFQDSSVDIDIEREDIVAIFDVQPLRNSLVNTLGVEIEYYTPSMAIAFLGDIYAILADCELIAAHKRKRNIGRLAHPKYSKYLRTMGTQPFYYSVEPDTSALSLIRQSKAVISAPFTSTALIARDAGKPSVYYDPTGMIDKEDRGGHGITILSGVRELRDWVKTIAVVGSSADIHGLQK